jgi:hypothetical protein
MRLPLVCLLAVVLTSCGGGAPPSFEITDIDFFESDRAEEDPFAPHNLATAFDVAALRYVHARVLAVSDEAVGADVTVPLSCVLQDQAGATIDTQARNVAFSPTATRTWWTVAFGSGQPGGWKAGRYRAVCTAGQNRVLGQFSVGPTLTAESSVLERAWEVLKPSPGLPPPIPDSTTPDPSRIEPSKPLSAPESALESQGKPLTVRGPMDMKHVLSFYESGDDDLETEQGHFAFDGSSARYIGFSLEYAPLGENEAFAFTTGVTDCAYQRLDSDVVSLTSFKLTASFADGPTVMSGRAGYKEPGSWAPGVYEFRCTYQGKEFARSGFLVRGLPLRLNQVLSRSGAGPARFNATEFRVFEAASPRTLPANPAYGSRFWNTSRYIVAHVTFEHEARQDASVVPVRCAFFDAVGRPIGAHVEPFQVSPGTTTGWVIGGWGNPNGGVWSPGMYLVECSAGSDLMAMLTFEIVRRQ